MPQEEHKWFIEHTSPFTAHMFAISDYVVSLRTEYQQLEIADTSLFGRILILDGKIQSSEYDEYIYHEALVHPAMLMCPAPQRVLVIGGGEGATLREILKYKTIERLVMVDLDQKVVELCRKYLKKWHQGSFEDSRLELIFMDARQYLEQSREKFDVIISDVPEPVEGGPALKLFTLQYFNLIKNHLDDNGFFSLQAGDYGLPFIDLHRAIYYTIGQVFPFAKTYRIFIPSFNTEWGFVLAGTRETNLANAKQFDHLINQRKLDLHFFDGQTAAGIFTLPADIRKNLASESKVIDDSNLFQTY